MPPLAQGTDILFYDGHCGLCHSAVEFVVKHDRSGTAFRFAPLYGKTFEATVPVDARSELSDSMVVQTDDGLLLMRSDALIHILQRLRGKWKVVAAMVAVIPRPLRDVFYNLIARIRYRVFGRRDHLCPVVPGSLRERFYP
jgi:predicted DCC family thiol-disulfide oxidoreductase YuxK